MHENRLIHENEKTYFTIAVIVSVIIYLSLIISLVGIFYIIIGVLITFFLHGLMIGSIRSNGVKLTEMQFPIIHKKVVDLCRQLDIREIPDVFIIQSNGILNAFATRFFGRNFVVLYSDIVELIEAEGEEELTFVIAHELAHIKRKHVSKQLLILPALWVPFLGNAYSRACEYTCDRMAAVYTGNPEAAMNGLSILAIGKILYKRMNRADYLMQSNKERGFFVWLSHVMSTHPPLPLRIMEIERLKKFPQFFEVQN
ncbi:M48 family metallopeptidase [Brevibacillus sp. SYSU BS000544]|uniref:M48 family metallopeptidase n=1 Tax=Brevibacillus sp. SYSU BS000544 TaxID=3416443 RepID=UPI003CE4C51D